MYNDIVDEILLKIILGTRDYNIIIVNCKSNETINRVCVENKELIGYELLKKRGYKNGNYTRFRRFLKLDSSLATNVKNIIKLYKSNDIDLLEMILDVEYNDIIKEMQKISVQELSTILLDTIYEKNDSDINKIMFMKLVHYDLFETKHLPNEEIFQKMLQEHNDIFELNYNLNEYIKLFISKINTKINFTNITSLETKIANMLKNWDYWIDNPSKM